MASKLIDKFFAAPQNPLEVAMNKDEFCRIVRDFVNRSGIERLMEWLETTDFFEAPASTRFHDDCPGGLVAHSLSVLKKLELLNEAVMDEAHKMSNESMVISALFHDLCKANFYAVSMRNVKNEDTGRWEKVPYYTVEDQFPFGHGEKSVFLIERFMKLKLDEAVAIRWHMGGFDNAVKGGSYTAGEAFEKFPAALLLHVADMMATYQDWDTPESEGATK